MCERTDRQARDPLVSARRSRFPADAARRVRAASWLGALLVLSAGCEQSDPHAGFTTLTVWAHQGQERENAAMRSIFDAFNAAHADQRLRLDVTFVPDRQYADKVAIASASGTLPDVLDVDGPYVGPWAAQGLLQPLDDLAGTALLDDMLPSLVAQGTYDGRLYALGAFESALVVYYNRAILERAGIEPPQTVKEAWTWDEFVAALRQVRPHAALPLSLHMDDPSDEWLTYAFAPLIWSSGGMLIDTEADKTLGVMNGPSAVGAIERWQALFEEGLAEPSSARPDPFSPGLAAFDWTGHWMLPSFEGADGLRFGVMPLPRMGEQVVTGSGSWCWGISRACEAPDAAWKLLDWLLDPERGIRPIVEANGAVPGRRSAFELFPAYEQMPRKLFRAQLEQAAHPRPRTRVYLPLTTEFARALRDIANGAAVEPRLTEAAEAVQRVLDR